ncbi:hypothetical protein J2Y03_001009 [Neobacillus niacini]|uniref:sporulation histidine kinase inhibitor Sda n=1 Tax=Neobacillus niacini TaxID=86668 RepID=UPI00285B5907|nr:sporulation histidine kinase inhibitor Sda [Neobacillus niacini]MDR7076006.1 hypothetical protein [Neobacillus niacini]
MECLSTKQLLESYILAIDLNLSKEFIGILGNELHKRDPNQSLFLKQGSKHEHCLFKDTLHLMEGTL